MKLLHVFFSVGAIVLFIGEARHHPLHDFLAARLSVVACTPLFP
jgi:hypothetical protein